MKKLNNMMCLDIYLSSLNKEAYEKIRHKIEPERNNRPPLMCWDIFSKYYFDSLKKGSKRSDLQQLSEILDKINITFDTSFIYDKTFTAMVLTDANQDILWVNKGFTDMTGYPKKFAIGKKPSFLQGTNTSKSTKKQIHSYLASGLPFKGSIVNYKSDNTEYLCEVEIFPIKNPMKETKAFLALETEIFVG